jgi:polyphenol oxidase
MVDFYTAELLGAEGWFGTRRMSGPTSVEALARLATTLGADYRAIAYAQQTHSTHAQRVTQAGEVPDCDALWTTEPGLWLAVKTADCVPVLGSFSNGVAAGVVAIHAGWRGAKAGIVPQTLAAIAVELRLNRADFRLVIGPCIGQANYEVGPEVVAGIDGAFWRTEGDSGKFWLDMGGWVAHQAAHWCGDAAQVARVDLDTYALPEAFHSWRRHCHEGKVNPYSSNLSLVRRG